MAWTELHGNLPTHPKVAMLANRLKIKRRDAVGILATMWCYAVEYTTGGVVDPWERFSAFAGLDDDVRVALIECEWLDEIGGKLQCRNWSFYAGRLEDIRRRDADRKRTSRGRPADIQRTSMSCPAESDQPDRTGPDLTNQTKPNISLTPDGVARDEKSTTLRHNRKPKPLMSQESLEAFETFWKAFPRRVGKGAARRAWAKIAPSEWDNIQQGCLKYRSLRENEDPKFTVHPATWLNQERWHDENDMLTPDGKRVGLRGVEYSPSDFDGQKF